MKPTTLTGLPRNARKLLAALRDRRPYVLPVGLQPGTPDADAHMTRLAGMLERAALITITRDTDNPQVVREVALTERGTQAAQGLR